MKMKQIIISAIIGLWLTPSFAAQTLTVTGGLKWTGYKVLDTSDAHTGDLKIKTGFLQVDGENIISGEFTIDMQTLSYKNKKLETHLKSPAFFNVEKFKESKFILKSCEKLLKPGANGETHKMAGDLTIRGKTNPIEFLATVKKENATWTAEAKTTIPDRSKFDIKYNSPAIFGLAKLADKAIADEIKIDLSLSASPASEAAKK